MIHRRLPRTPAQSLVEFALIAPLLFAMMFILVELGIVFSIYIGLTNSAREAARAGVAYQYNGMPLLATTNCEAYSNRATIDTAREALMDTAVMGSLNPIIRANSIADLNPTSGSRYSYQPPLATPSTCPGSAPTPPLEFSLYRNSDMVIVNLAYQHGLFFGLLGPRSITITAHSEMRLEPGGVAPTPTPVVP